jgi:GNAT superfamily N-acetyltransferase
MSLSFRLVDERDLLAYQSLIHKAYASIRELGIHFLAADADLALIGQHVADHAVYVLELDGVMAASVTIRFPWSSEPGPYGLPHLGWFATDPAYARQGLARKLLHWLEAQVLTTQLHAPAISLGTAEEHPWLVQMYTALGFEAVGKNNLGRGHTTIYMRKVLDPKAYFKFIHTGVQS